MIRFSLQVTIPLGKKNEIVKTFHQIFSYMRVQPGCIQYKLYMCTENDDELLIIEEWNTLSCLEKHILSDEFDIVLSVIDMAIKEPIIRIDAKPQYQGMEFIKSVRKSNKTF
jgi:quinol monooxygenase YgiN